MIIPPVPKSLIKGDPLTAKWLMVLRDAVNARTPLPSPGVRFRKMAHGFQTLLNRQQPGAEEQQKIYASCLTPKKFILEPDLTKKVKVVFNPAELRACGITQQGVMHPVRYGTGNLRSDPAPEIELEDGENTIYIYWTTDDHGDVDANSVWLTLTLPTGLATHIPESPGTSAIPGGYMQIAGVIDVPEPDEGATVRSGSPTWIPLADHLSWETFEREMINLGGGAEVAKDITLDQERYRSLIPAMSEPAGANVFDVWVNPDQKEFAIEFPGKVKIDGVTADHPWKATDDGTGNITIAAGKVMFPLNKGGAPDDPLPIVYDYVSFAGGAIGVGANGWVYVKCEVSAGDAFAGQESLNIQRGEDDPFTSIQLKVRKITALSLVFSTDDPAGYTPPDDHIYIAIAEVSFAAAVASVEDQILTHNPLHDLTTDLNFSV